MKTSFLSILVLLVSVVSCSNPGGKDYSYTIEKYLELGMPDINKPWKVSEFGDVIGTLRPISYNEPLSLPRKGSRKSGKLFDHMISMDNLSFLKLDTLPLYEKAYRIQSFILIQSEYIDIYTDIHRREQYYNQELIEFYLFGIRVTQEMVNLGFKINDSDEPGDVGMQSGFNAIQHLHVTMLADAIDKQKNISLYNPEDLETLSDSIVLSIKRNMSWIDSTQMEKIKQKMLVAIDSSKSDKIRDEYRDIINRL